MVPPQKCPSITTSTRVRVRVLHVDTAQVPTPLGSVGQQCLCSITHLRNNGISLAGPAEKLHRSSTRLTTSSETQPLPLCKTKKMHMKATLRVLICLILTLHFVQSGDLHSKDKQPKDKHPKPPTKKEKPLDKLFFGGLFPGEKNVSDQTPFTTKFQYPRFLVVRSCDHGRFHSHPSTIRIHQHNQVLSVLHTSEPPRTGLRLFVLFSGKCNDNAVYIRDAYSLVFCSNRNKYIQPCAPGTRNGPLHAYLPGQKTILEPFFGLFF